MQRVCLNWHLSLGVILSMAIIDDIHILSKLLWWLYYCLLLLKLAYTDTTVSENDCCFYLFVVYSQKWQSSPICSSSLLSLGLLQLMVRRRPWPLVPPTLWLSLSTRNSSSSSTSSLNPRVPGSRTDSSLTYTVLVSLMNPVMYSSKNEEVKVLWKEHWKAVFNS